jgi:hypothetical protein
VPSGHPGKVSEFGVSAGQGFARLALPGAGAGHPWPCPLPAGWRGVFGEREPLAFIPVEPTVVAEVGVDTALDGPFRRIRHRGRLVRIRLDLHPDDITTGSGETPNGHAGSGAVGPLTQAGHR